VALSQVSVAKSNEPHFQHLSWILIAQSFGYRVINGKPKAIVLIHRLFFIEEPVNKSDAF
jgi:hypothetical protein